MAHALSQKPLRQILFGFAHSLSINIRAEEGFLSRFEPPRGYDPADPPDLSNHVNVGPDALGDIFEALRGDARDAEFAGLIEGTLRHGGATQALASTQRFTPPWIARWLVEKSLERASRPWPCVDPACGGGRLLLSLFDGLRARGHDPHTILGEALYGLDVDPLAADVARWSLWLEAARFCSPESRASLPVPNIMTLSAGPVKLLGSLSDFEALKEATGGVVEEGRFAVVVANPPYMGSRHMSKALRAAIGPRYGAFKGDLYTAFLDRCAALTASDGAMAVLCQQSFLFLERDRAMRRALLERINLEEVLHLGPHAFAGIAGEKAAVVAFVATPVGPRAGRSGEVIDLSDVRTAEGKAEVYVEVEGGERGHRRYSARQALVRTRETGDPLSYWWPEALNHLRGLPTRLGDALDIVGSSNKTAANATYVRYWWEVDPAHIGATRLEEARCFVPYAKGGAFKKWTGNLERVVDWSAGARAYYRDNPTSNLLDARYWFREGITYSDFGGRAFSARHLPAGCVFDMAGPGIFVPEDLPGDLSAITFWLAFLNAELVCHLLNAKNATIHYQVGDLRRLPIPSLDPDDPRIAALATLGAEACVISRRVDRRDPLQPGAYTPVLLETSAELPPERRLTDAAARLQADRRALGQIEARINRAVEAIYGVDREDVAPLDRRYDPPKAREVDVDGVAMEAMLFAVGVTTGHFALDDPVGDRLDTLDRYEAGLMIFGAPLWAAILGRVGGKGGASLKERATRALFARFKRRAYFGAS